MSVSTWGAAPCIWHDGQKFELGDEVTVNTAFTVEDAEVTTEEIGTIEQITDDERLYVVFHDVEYTETYGGGKVTVSSVFDVEEVSKA